VSGERVAHSVDLAHAAFADQGGDLAVGEGLVDQVELLQAGEGFGWDRAANSPQYEP
jgi:hypothetical protein